jgi:hypothetical protein
MDPLEEYLYGASIAQESDAQHVGEILSETWSSYKHFGTLKSWPYEVVDFNEPDRPKRNEYSLSTNGMILCAVAAHTGLLRQSPLLPDLRFPICEETGALKELKTQFRGRVDHLLSTSDQLFAQKGGIATQSSTYGNDDPFSLTWALEAVRATAAIKDGVLLDEKPVVQIVEAALKTVQKAFSTPEKPVLSWPDGSWTSIEHIFPLLRAIHLNIVLNLLKQENQKFFPTDADDKLVPAKQSLHNRVRWFCLSRIHQHLALAKTNADGFDPAELAFAVEAILLIDRTSMA